MLMVFLPVLLLARFFFVSATALYVASVLPSWILTLVFLVRLWMLGKRRTETFPAAEPAVFPASLEVGTRHADGVSTT